jgi:hypothetical protein
MPQQKVDPLHRFLPQGNGHLPRRALTREFEALTETVVEKPYADSFRGIALAASEDE